MTGRRPDDRSRTSGDHEQGQGNSQIHQEEDNTKDGIGNQMTGDQMTGNQLTRTSGDYSCQEKGTS